MEEFMEYFWLLLPIIVIQFILILIAMIDWYKQGNDLRGNRWLWFIIILAASIIGPILYFLIGRRTNE